MSNIIGITMGDPCGVGPEITVRALAEMSAPDRAATRIYGNLATLEAARDALGVDIDLTQYVVDLPVEGAPLPWGCSHCARSAAYPSRKACIASVFIAKSACPFCARASFCS